MTKIDNLEGLIIDILKAQEKQPEAINTLNKELEKNPKNLLAH